MASLYLSRDGISSAAFSCLALVLLAAPLGAQEPWRFESGPDSHPGWPVEAVETVTLDSRGFIWFGSENGLYRYDGYGSRVYRHDIADPHSLGGSQVEDLLEDRHGILWVATDGGGLDRFVRAEERFEHFRHDLDRPRSLSHDSVRCLLEDRTGVLWVGTSGGLDRFDAEAEGFTHDLRDAAVFALFEGREDILWVGTARGLVRFDRGAGQAEAVVRYRHDRDDPTSLSHDRVLALAGGGDGGLWVATEKGLNLFDPATERFQRFLHDPDDPTSLAHDEIQDLHLDRDGILWVGTFGGGLDLFDPATGVFEHHRNDPTDPSSLSGNGVRTIFEDPAGIVWLGTYGGLNKYDRMQERFQVLTKRTLGSKMGQGIWEEPSGILWTGGTDRLSRVDREQGRIESWAANPDRDGALPPGYVAALWKDEGGLWVGSWGGLCRFEEERGHFDCYRHDPTDPETLPDDKVYTLFEDSRERFWVGTFRGLCEFDRASKRCRRVAERPDAQAFDLSAGVHSVTEDRSGAIWFASRAGLYRLTERLERFGHDPDDPTSLSSDQAVMVHEDRQGTLWVGTWGGGLNRRDDASGAFRRYGEADGLPSATVTSILEDDDGRLWIGTYGGLSRFDPATEIFRNYDKGDGLAGNVMSVYGNFRGSRGEMFFGGAGGLTMFFPDQVIDDPHRPPVVITALELFGEPVRLRSEDPASPLERPILETRELTFSHEQNVFAFEFAALSYRRPEKNRYLYKLEGFDRDWSATNASRRRVRYTNLDPGTYTFRVKASNADGVWNEDGTSVAITVRPPPWKTWWAYTLYVLTAALAGGGVLRGQQQKLERERELQRKEAERDRRIIRRLREVDRLKDEFLANTSHELRTPLHGMIGLAESLADGARGEVSTEARADLGMLIASGRRLGSLVDDILDFSRLKEKDLELTLGPVDVRSLTEVVLILARPLAGGKELVLENAVDPDLPAAWADENRLQQILLNLVGNAVKFTDEGVVEVSATVADTPGGGEITVHVRDTGIGIAPERRERIFQAFEQADASTERIYGGTGLGLAVSEKLVTLHGGRIWVDSIPGEGSTFSFSLPVSAEAMSRSEGDTLAAGLPAALTAMPVSVGNSTARDAAAAGGQRVLVVDDEAVNRQVLINHLSASNYAVEAAVDGVAALERLAEGRFDLVLLDIMMPRLSGYEVCQRLREDHSLEELPVIFLSAKSQPADLVYGFEAGANDYLVKPITKEELLARVRTHLDLAAAHRLVQAQHRTVELQAQELGAQTEALAARNAEIAHFTSAISHDLRNPLTTIQLLVGFVERQSGLDALEMKRSIEQIRGAADTMEKLMGDLVELSRVGRAMYSNEEVDLAEVIRAAAEVLSEAMEERGVELEVANGLPVIPGDRRRLFEAVQNVLSNAVKFLGDQAAPRVEIGLRDDDGTDVIFVRDNGIGIAPRYRERVFALFEQLDPQVEGTGVGLALARRVIELHGGRIWIESEGEGRGCTVCLTLPARQLGA